MNTKLPLPIVRIAAAVSALLAAGHGMSAAAANGGLVLPPGVQAQIGAILAEKANRTPAEAKIDSNLLNGMRAVAQAAAGRAQPPVPFVQDFLRNHVAADSTVKVSIKAKVTSGLLAALQAAGASEVNAVADYDSVTARLPISELTAISALPEVRFVGVYFPPVTNRYQPTPVELRAWQDGNTGFDGLTGPIGNVGAATSQGVAAHAADKVQQTGITGAGQKVCVLSDGVDSMAGRQASGDLPASVDVVTGQAGSGDEGTAMLEIVYDMAPGAALGFASGFNGDAQMATNIKTLRNTPHNCTVIVDDVTYFLEPPFQEGIIANAVTTVSTSGAPYFSSAANSGSLLKGTSGTWEGDFVNGGNLTVPGLTDESGTVHSFGSSISNTLTQAHGPYILSWSDPQGASSNDYDLIIFNSTMTTVLGFSTSTQSGTQDPVEGIGGSAAIPSGSKIVVLNWHGAAAPRALRLDTERGRLAINTKGNTFGHNAGVNTITLAAVNVATAGGGVFVGGAANPVESFSSDGPRRLFYNPVPATTAITPGNVLFGTNGGTLLNKVDLAAADGTVSTTPGFSPFFGTSAAAPHAAAIAALVKSAKPSLTPAQVKSALVAGAKDIETTGYDVTSGAGLIRADLAVRSVLSTIGVAKAFAPTSIATGGTSVLSITLSNTNAVALKNIALTDTYPANVKTASTPAASFTGTGCAGTVVAAAGGTSVALSSATVPAGGSCVLKVNVTSAVASVYADASGSLTTPMGLNSAAASATLTVTAGNTPDFVVTSIAGSPSSPAVNSAFRVTVTVKNQGSATGNGGVLGLWANQAAAQACSAVSDLSATVGSLAAGASKTLTFNSVSAGAVGAKTLRAFVDKNCATAESNDANNQSTLAYNVVGVPDLLVTGITLSPTGPAAGGTFSAIVSVKNQGTASSTAGWLDVWTNQTAIQPCYSNGNGFVAIPSLAAGASTSFTVTGLAAGTAGSKTLRAYVDSFCSSSEPNEINNQLTKVYSVL